MTRDSILMARRKSKRSPRRKFTGLAVLPALEAYVQTSIWTEAALGVNPIEFFTGITTSSGVTSFRPGTDGDVRITLPEILGAGPGGIGGNFTGTNSLQAQISTNMGGIEGVIMTGLKSAGVGIGFRLVNKMTRKARSGLNRQILKPLGVSTMVRL